MNVIKLKAYGKFPFIGRNRMLLALSKSKKARRTNMIKTLRITSVLAVVLAVVLFVLPAVFGVRSDEQAEQFLTSPGAIEQFNKAKGETGKKSESQVSPLVKEAEAFALYLNPPKPKAPPRRPPRDGGAMVPRPRAPVSAKFSLIGTSYYALRPELSLALIDEPGKGFRWVRQSSNVGHLVIEQIKDGVVVVRDGKSTSELEVQRPKKRSLVKGSVSDARITSTEPSQISAEEEALLGRVVSEVEPPPWWNEGDDAWTEGVSAEPEAVQPPAGEARMERIFNELETMRVSAEEARRLGRLGKKLEQVQQEPNRAPDDGTESDPNKAP
jgi:hypothetical protein